jgi:hypothetical protein
MRKLLRAVRGNPDALNGFVRGILGVASPAAFFSGRTSDGLFAATETQQGGEGATILGPGAPERREFFENYTGMKDSR